MSFSEVFDAILAFIESEPDHSYRLMIGTDSQVHPRFTRFVTGIVILRQGKGAWACLRKYDFPFRVDCLYTKISIETKLTEQIADYFTIERRKLLLNQLRPFLSLGASFVMEGHLDIGKGKKSKTKIYVEEMMKRIEGQGMKPCIKPEAFVASAYANRYTK